MSKSSITTDTGSGVTRLPQNRAPVHPGEMLREEFLRPLEMTQTELARRTTAEFWLNGQRNWDLMAYFLNLCYSVIRKDDETRVPFHR